MPVTRKRMSACVLLSIAALALSACSLFERGANPIEYLREQVQATVADAERSEAMLACVDRLDALMIESATLLAESARAERRLFRDYDSTPEDFARLGADTSLERRRLQQAILDAHLEFKRQTTEDEWATLAVAETRAVTARARMLIADSVAQRTN